MQNQQGMSLVGVMVALAVSGFVAAALAQVMGFSFRAQKKLELSQEFRQISDRVASKLRCSHTTNVTTRNTCTDGQVVGLVDHQGGVLVSSSNTAAGATRIGRWTVRAICRRAGASFLGFEVQAARPKSTAAAPLTATSDGDFMGDPLNPQRTSRWDVPAPATARRTFTSSLFATANLPCSDIAAAPSCPQGQVIINIDPSSGSFECGPLLPASCTPGRVVTVGPGGSLTCVPPTYTRRQANMLPYATAPQNGIVNCIGDEIPMGVGARCGTPGALEGTTITATGGFAHCSTTGPNPHVHVMCFDPTP